MKLFDIVCTVVLVFTAGALGWHQFSERFPLPGAPQTEISQDKPMAGDGEEAGGVPEIFFTDEAPAPTPKSWGVGEDPQYRVNQDSLDPSSEEVFFGEKLDPGALPEVVALNQTDTPSTNGLCTGTLIAKRMAITAGHCIDASIKKVLLGDAVSNAAAVYDVENLLYLNTPQDLDIGIVLLKQDADGVTPAIIAPSAWVDRATWIAVAGFGADESRSANKQGKKLYAAIPIATNDCSRSDVLGYSDAKLYDCVAGAELVAKGVFNNFELSRIEEKYVRDKVKADVDGGNAVDTCKGDSGSGAFITAPENHQSANEFAQAVLNDRYLAAVTSRVVRMASDIKTEREEIDGTPYTNCGDGGIYVRFTSEVLSEIQQWASLYGQEVKISDAN